MLWQKMPHGITAEEKLHVLDRAEQFLIEPGFFEEHVRMHGIEVLSESIPRLAVNEIRETVNEKYRETGFLFITLDMKGYKSWSMNATLKNRRT